MPSSKAIGLPPQRPCIVNNLRRYVVPQNYQYERLCSHCDRMCRARDLDLKELLQFDPDGGILRYANERVLLLDAVALGLLRRELVETLGLAGARCQLTPYSRPLVFAHRGPRVFTRKGATRFRVIGGHLFSPDRGPGVYARSGATSRHLPFSSAPSTPVCFVQREATWQEGERTCWRFES